MQISRRCTRLLVGFCDADVIESDCLEKSHNCIVVANICKMVEVVYECL